GRRHRARPSKKPATTRKPTPSAASTMRPPRARMPRAAPARAAPAKAAAVRTPVPAVPATIAVHAATARPPRAARKGAARAAATAVAARSTPKPDPSSGASPARGGRCARLWIERHHGTEHLARLLRGFLGHLLLARTGRDLLHVLGAEVRLPARLLDGHWPVHRHHDPGADHQPGTGPGAGPLLTGLQHHQIAGRGLPDLPGLEAT